jgi:hypothetical protein
MAFSSDAYQLGTITDEERVWIEDFINNNVVVMSKTTIRDTLIVMLRHRRGAAKELKAMTTKQLSGIIKFMAQDKRLTRWVDLKPGVN